VDCFAHTYPSNPTTLVIKVGLNTKYYIVFRNIENFKKKIPQICFMKENKRFNRIFGKISFFEIVTSKLIS